MVGWWWERLFPLTQACWNCGTPTRSAPLSSVPKQLCFACIRQFTLIDSPVCQACGRPSTPSVCSDCQRVPTDEWVHNRSLFEYTPFAKQLIWRYKYKGQEHLAHPLGCWMAEQFFHMRGTDRWVITYVPLHPNKLRQRGFNQAEQLANVMAQRLRLPTISLLKRYRMTPSQSEKNRQERLASLEGAFQLKENIHVESLIQHRILLIDDVYTTGATLRECGNTLKNIGIKNIYSMTIAR